jgi:hypothetical protein
MNNPYDRQPPKPADVPAHDVPPADDAMVTGIREALRDRQAGKFDLHRAEWKQRRVDAAAASCP